MNVLLELDAHPVIGHRGAAMHAPENTLPSFAAAVEAGVDAIELDVHVTADGIPVVIHDATLDRTTDRRGAVAALTLAQVQEADAGAHFTVDGGRTFPWRGRGVRVPTLDEVLAAFPGVPVALEVKTPQAQGAIRRLLEARGEAGRCVVAASAASALAAFRAAPFLLGACQRDTLRLLLGALLHRPPRAVPYRALFLPEHHRGIPIVTPRLVAAARALGCPVHVWTVDTVPRAARLWEAGVAGIVSNDPGTIIAARDARRGA
ncbi:MAG TPA: glycerophosphodiester phosphodiesterase family protein [Gemmatimonadaceae bacterium]|nr:glycerophosphodiester phosphodiesterase family protein [Gemmatimonadaceae bacterium]